MNVMKLKQLQDMSTEVFDAIKAWNNRDGKPFEEPVSNPLEAQKVFVSYWWAAHEIHRHRADIIHITLDMASLVNDDNVASRAVLECLELERDRHMTVQKQMQRHCCTLRRDWDELIRFFEWADKSSNTWLEIRPGAEVVEP
jgi:hypothetical protein